MFVSGTLHPSLFQKTEELFSFLIAGNLVSGTVPLLFGDASNRNTNSFSYFTFSRNRLSGTLKPDLFCSVSNLVGITANAQVPQLAPAFVLVPDQSADSGCRGHYLSA